ncbi:META domain-containing protein [Vogesella indigofera]|uniref:META domain-containing protein n=1 Tax=Vogesella indigofera TaxID=45465 RepID=UPI003F433E25
MLKSSLLRGLLLLLPFTPLPALAQSLPDYPATYRGELPCADCAGVSWQLDLWDERYYTLRQVYHGKPQPLQHDQMGVWRMEDGRLHLSAANEAPLLFAVRNKRLTKLDNDGRLIVSRLNYSLRRARQFAPIEPRLQLSGLYQYMADAGTIELCELGMRLPVMAEGDNAALERAYLATRQRPGERLLVRMEATLAPRHDEAGYRLSVIPQRFGSISQRQRCDGAAVPDTTLQRLQQERWHLRTLAGKPLAPNVARPYFELDAATQRVSGVAGCNRFDGSYRLSPAKLRFRQLSSTRQACPQHREIEPAFLAALASARRWQWQGGDLLLLDEHGQQLASLMPLLR